MVELLPRRGGCRLLALPEERAAGGRLLPDDRCAVGRDELAGRRVTVGRLVETRGWERGWLRVVLGRLTVGRVARFAGARRCNVGRDRDADGRA